jgi:SET domain-containing protein
MRKYPKKDWFDDRIEIRDSNISGKGSFAKSPIKKGEKVIQWGGGYIVTKKEFERDFPKGKYMPESSVTYDENHKWVHLADSKESPDPFLNHSCDPNLWFIEGWSLEARRDINAGEELTFDYSTGETYPLQSECGCGSKNCRKNVTGGEWKDKKFREKYKGHFNAYIQGLIDKEKST